MFQILLKYFISFLEHKKYRLKLNQKNSAFIIYFFRSKDLEYFSSDSASLHFN